MEATSSGSTEIPTSVSEENCKWHKKLQNKIKAIRNSINSHDVITLEEEASNASREWNKMFKEGDKDSGNESGPSEWEKIKTFHVKPISFEMKELQMLVEDEIRGRDPSNVIKKEIKDLKIRIVEEIRNDLRVKYKKKDVEREVHKLNVKEYVDNHLSADIGKYLGEKSENKVEKALCNIMTGKPGLLRRGLTFNKKTFEHLKSITGPIRPLNCKCKFGESCKLEDKCFDVETDLILLYQNENKISIRIIEVKRIEKEITKNFNQLSNALDQLTRDVKLMLSLLPDVNVAFLDIQVFAAFPETKTHHLFCSDCTKYIISKEDFDLGIPHLKQKLFINDPTLNDENEELLLKTCARMIGHEKSKDFEAINKFIINYESTVDTLLFLDEDQQSLLGALDEDPPKWNNFALRGPSGSGKTIISIKIVNKLIDRYLMKGEEKVFVYATSFGYHGDDMKLIRYFRNNIIKQDEEKIVSSVKSFSKILSDFNIEKEYANPSANICDLCDAVKKKHGNHPVIIVIDECLATKDDETKGDWSELCPYSPDDKFHMILAFSPINKHIYSDAPLVDFKVLNGDFKEKTLWKRYRNSHEIQTLIKFINSEYSDKCRNFEVKFAPPLSISSSLPVWIDVGDKHHLLSSAIETIKKLHYQKSADQSKGPALC